ncbi:hypothetical protein [Demequina sp. SO4-18]|uniref:hypothetical protein n=1 Tax=Demequina sp. SO4-18 TaxID=3401026 RepID=UPI003B5CDC3B
MTTEAAAMYVAHYPGGDWSQVPDHLKRIYIKAAEERANPTRCANCGSTADYHADRSKDGCMWVSSTRTTPPAQPITEPMEGEL